MSIVRPRITDFHGISVAQSDSDFAIPFLDEDIPLYVDPFLLWKSPSQQDQALHTSLINSFNRQNWLQKRGKQEEATQNLILASECDEVGLGVSATRQGKRIGAPTAQNVLDIFGRVPEFQRDGFVHFEEIQLYVDGISKDRVSDFACSFLKSFLVDYTIQQCDVLGIPRAACTVASIYNYQRYSFDFDVKLELPVHPDRRTPILLTPKRWLRYVPWINFDDYFKAHCPKDDVVNKLGSDERVQVLTYNRDNYGVVAAYVQARERAASDCRSDPLFQQIPVLSARRKFEQIKKLPTGKEGGADKEYEDAATTLLASLLYPHLDFASEQSRTDSGTQIRDVIFYNNRSVDFLKEILDDYHSRQLTFELKNVKAIDRDHINQLNRYLTQELEAFGVLVTRNPLSTAMQRNTIDLWAGQRRCIVALTDADLELMVQVFDSKQRDPIDVLKRAYVEFRRLCPS